MHEYKLQIEYTGHPSNPRRPQAAMTWNITVTRHDEQLSEESHHSLLLPLNRAGKLIRQIEVDEFSAAKGER